MIFNYGRQNYNNMKKLIVSILIAIMVIPAGTAMAQETLSKKEQKKIEKAARKQEKKENLAKNKFAVLESIDNMSFVIEANTIQGNSLYTYQVNSNTNFIKVEGDHLVLQTASNYGLGYNGLGGITLIGQIVDFEVDEGKGNKATRITAQVTSPVAGHSTIFLTISSNGYSTARFSDNWGNRLVFNGEFHPLENSRVYQGSPVI